MSDIDHPQIVMLDVTEVQTLSVDDSVIKE